MICERAKEQIGAYLDGELPPGARGDVDAHLVTCSSCRAEFEALGAMATELAARHAEEQATAPVPDALWTAIENRLDSETQAFAEAMSPHRRVATVRSKSFHCRGRLTNPNRLLTRAQNRFLKPPLSGPGSLTTGI